MLVNEKKHPKKIEFGTQRANKIGGQNRGTYVSPIIYYLSFPIMYSAAIWELINNFISNFAGLMQG